MKLKKINLDTVVIKESFGKVKSITYKEIIMSVLLIIIAVYFSTTLWIIMMRGAKGDLDSSSLLLISAIISSIFGVLYFILRFPIVLFLSKLNKRLLYLPIKPHKILLTRYRYLLAIQIIINVIITIPLLFLVRLNLFVYISFFIYLTLVLVIIDYILIILLFIIGVIVSKKYIQLALIGTSVFSGFIISIFFKFEGIAILGYIINNFLSTKNPINTVFMLLILFGIAFILHILIIFICDKFFKDIHYKTLFNKASNSLRKRVYNIHNPYIFLEVRFILRNKSFLIYSVLKSLFLVYIMLRLITGALVMDNSLQIMLCIIFVSCFNPLSITAISRDLKQIKIMRAMPVDFKKMILSKVVVSASINFAISLILVMMLKFKYEIPVGTYLLFSIAYSIFSATIGVYTDLADPNDSYDNLNDLIRNNGGTITQFIISIIVIFTAIILRRYFDYYCIILNIILLVISILIIKYKEVEIKYD